jgi:zinc transport system substrate-binding protein
METNSLSIMGDNVKTISRVICISAVALALGASPLVAQPRVVVATNTWTAALAAAAGAAHIVTLAPGDLRHPAEYELKPSDVARLRGADVIVYTGFETMAKKLASAAGDGSIKMLHIDADYSVATMRTSIMAIATVLGTEPKARESVAALERFITAWKAELQSKRLFGVPVVAHVFQVPLLKDLGFDIKGVFGPGPLEAAQIAKLSPIPATFIVDNWHNEAAVPLRETMKAARYVSLINFPGPDGTASLLDVLADNRKRMEEASK